MSAGPGAEGERRFGLRAAVLMPEDITLTATQQINLCNRQPQSPAPTTGLVHPALKVAPGGADLSFGHFSTEAVAFPSCLADPGGLHAGVPGTNGSLSPHHPASCGYVMVRK